MVQLVTSRPDITNILNKIRY